MLYTTKHLCFIIFILYVCYTLKTQTKDDEKEERRDIEQIDSGILNRCTYGNYRVLGCELCIGRDLVESFLLLGTYSLSLTTT